MFRTALLRLTQPRRLQSGVSVSIVPFLIEPGRSISMPSTFIKVMNVQHIYVSGSMAEQNLEEILVKDAQLHFRMRKMSAFGTILTN